MHISNCVGAGGLVQREKSFRMPLALLPTKDMCTAESGWQDRSVLH